MVTRAREQAEEFVARLETQGAEVLSLPMIQILDPLSWDDVDRAREALASFDWIVLTSANAVERWTRRANELQSAAFSSSNKIAAVGVATARQIERLGMRVDLIPNNYSADGLLAAFGAQLHGKKFLLPRGNLARPELPRALKARGAEVHEVVVYRTESGLRSTADGVAQIERGEVDVITFASPSAVEGFAASVSDEKLVHGRFVAASIGPTTSAALRQHGFEVPIEAVPSTLDALAEAIVRYFHLA